MTHQNTTAIMAWADRMQAKYGKAPGGFDWCRAFAYFVDEAGRDFPSEDAMRVAYQLEEYPMALYKYWEDGKREGAE